MACAPQPANRPEADPALPNIIVYLVDTLRADHLGCYGYARPTSPTIDGLAADAVIFDNAYTQASWTKPAVATLFTGLYPSRHGAVRREHALRGDVPTMAEVLRGVGYSTVAVISNPNILPVYGFDRGFDEFVDVESVQRTARAADVHRAVLETLDEHPRRPLFLYIHTRDPHDPYEPPPPYDTIFADAPVPGSAGAGSDTTVRRRALYDGEIAYGDAELAVLIEHLRSVGLWDSSVVVFLSDHGEELGGRGGWGHGTSLFEEQIHVPLIVRIPDGVRGGRVEHPVRLVDILPTLCELLGVDAPEGLDGQSFAGLLDGKPADGYDPTMYAELNNDRHVVSSLTTGRFKLIERQSPTVQAGRRLFDLSDDPAEVHDLSADEPATAGLLRQEMTRVEARLNHGIYLEICNGTSRDERHRVRGSIEVIGGRFERVIPTDLEDGDRLDVTEDGVRLELDVRLRSRDNPIGQRPFVIRDVDRFRLLPSPESQTLEIDLSIDGEPAGPKQLLIGQGFTHDGPLPLVVPVQDQHLQLSTSGHALRTPVLAPWPYCWLFSIAQVSVPQVEADDELEDRLRALGYVE